MSTKIVKERIETETVILFDSFEDWVETLRDNPFYSTLLKVCVPRKTYKNVKHYQEVMIGMQREWQFVNREDEPVALKGAKLCRLAQYRYDCDYINCVYKRYIQMKKITCVNPYEWNEFTNPLPRFKRWNFHSRSLSAGFPSHMVNEYGTVLIKGKSYRIENPERLKIVKDIFNYANKVKLP